jgi:hypothetical protein
MSEGSATSFVVAEARVGGGDEGRWWEGKLDLGCWSERER